MVLISCVVLSEFEISKKKNAFTKKKYLKKCIRKSNCTSDDSTIEVLLLFYFNFSLIGVIKTDK